MRRGRVIPGVVIVTMTTAALACSEPTEVENAHATGAPQPPGASTNVMSTNVMSTNVMSTNVVHVASGDRGIMGVFDGVTVYGSGYGSAIAFAPNGTRDFYLLTDRGPNIDFPAGNKGFPVPSYAPRIVKAHLSGDQLRLDGEILLRRADGAPLTGLPVGAGVCGNTGETAFRLDGSVIPPDPQGIDSEGLVVLDDGAFWVSDEYGPFLAKFGPDGREIQRLSPCNGGLPPVYATRRPNRGMEGLTSTPDGKWLVGMMQAPLENPTSTGVRNVSRLTRMLFKNIATGATREYAYLLENPTLQGNSEILALSSTKFLVLERDGLFALGSPPSTVKRIYEADITTATDISTLGALGAAPIAGKTLEQATVAELLAAGVVPATKTLRVDLVAAGFPHDKAEGLALGPGNMLFVTDDDDFGITTGAVGVMIQKLLPPMNTPDFVSVWQFKLK
jgi:hypothetical protein